MKKIIIIIFFLIFSHISVFSQALTPYTVSMNTSDNNAAAFTSYGQVGTDVATFYIHWDNTYLYLGWSGGNTLYSSDMYYAAIDTDPTGTNGLSNAIEGVEFQTGAQLPDFYVVYENNQNFYGVPATNGNAFELYKVVSGNWTFISRTDGDDSTSSQIVFSNPGEVRLRIAWSSLSFTPGNSTSIGIVMWANNSSGNYMWARVPTDNPSTGDTPKTLTHQFIYNSTGDGVNPSTAGTSTPLPVELTSFTAFVKDGVVTLNWQTATEVNNYGFDIERKTGTNTDQSLWEQIGFVEGHGNSNSTKSYIFTDNSVSYGSYLYRLKQIDTDGSFEYSNTVEVFAGKFPEGFILEQNYPNPFNPVTSIRFGLEETAHASLKVYNSIGKEVATLFDGRADAGKIYDVSFSADGLSSGVYLYKLSSDKFTRVMKMIIMK
ncbi:MAG: hypothetical protein Kow0098_02520 [Ignavibacteriaceae bacterium]